MTVLMHSWYYEKKDLRRSPSILDGLDIERESRYRREGARFIINVGTKMGLRYDTMATGVVYFHRFYMFHSFKTFPRYVTACCCLFLAGKVEETPKKCKDIIRTAKTFIADLQFAQFGDDPKEEVMTLERILLQTIKFDLQVDHPYGHLLKYAKSLKGDKSKLHNMVQMAWTFINDSLCTTLCLQWEPEVIAIALMYLAGKLSKFEVVDWNGRTARHNHWWDMFVEGMSVELLEDICHQVLDLYSAPSPRTPQDSPPATPPTKSTRKTSQPPSPVETTTSPAQIKPKDPPVGQPIPRLEPGELKRKTSQNDINKELIPEAAKIPRVTEGKAIPTISSHSPKAAPSSLGSDTQPSSPSTPVQQDTVKNVKDVQRVTSDPIYKSGLASSNPPTFAQKPSFSAESNQPKHVPQVAVTSFSVSIPPPTTTYTQPAPPFFSENQPFPNMQQPPPQIFPQRPPVPFQHPPPLTPTGQPPPPPPPPGLHAPPPPHQYPPNLPPSGVPPFNSQFPPPRHQPPPPSLISNPPAPVPGITQHPPPPPPSHPQGPPVPGMIRNVPPPPGVHPVHHMVPENIYRANSNIYSPDQRGRPPKDRLPQNQDFVPRPRFDSNFRGRRDSDFDPPFPRDQGYRRPPPPNKFNQEFERPPHPNRRFPLDHQQHRKHERGPPPSVVNNNPQHQHQHGGPTGIPPVRITGSQ